MKPLKNVPQTLFLLLVFFTLSFASSAQSVYCPLLLDESFDMDPPLASGDTDGAWYVDRYPPAAFEADAGRLKISIDGVADGAANRGAQSGTFYNTQGRKFNQCNCVNSFRGDLYIPSEWATLIRRSDMWATAFNAADNISFYPIIGFGNVDGSSPTLRFYDSFSGWININVPINYDSWTTFEFFLDGADLVYLVNGTEVGRIDNNGSTYFGNIIMQAYNFNDPNLDPASYDPNPATNSYDVFWDNLVSDGDTCTNVIPTMGEWALFLSGLLIFTLGVVGLYNVRLRVRA